MRALAILVGVVAIGLLVLLFSASVLLELGREMGSYEYRKLDIKYGI